MLDALDGGQALFFRSLADRVGAPTDDQALVAAICGIWCGPVS